MYDYIYTLYHIHVLLTYMLIYTYTGVEKPTVDGRCDEDIVKASGKMVSIVIPYIYYIYTHTYLSLYHYNTIIL